MRRPPCGRRAPSGRNARRLRRPRRGRGASPWTSIRTRTTRIEPTILAAQRRPGKRQVASDDPERSRTSAETHHATSRPTIPATSSGVNSSVASPTVSSTTRTEGESPGDVLGHVKTLDSSANPAGRRNERLLLHAEVEVHHRRLRRIGHRLHVRHAAQRLGNRARVLAVSRHQREPPRNAASPDAALGHIPNSAPPCRFRHARTSSTTSSSPARQQPANPPRPL